MASRSDIRIQLAKAYRAKGLLARGRRAAGARRAGRRRGGELSLLSVSARGVGFPFGAGLSPNGPGPSKGGGGGVPQSARQGRAERAGPAIVLQTLRRDFANRDRCARCASFHACRWCCSARLAAFANQAPPEATPHFATSPRKHESGSSTSPTRRPRNT